MITIQRFSRRYSPMQAGLRPETVAHQQAVQQDGGQGVNVQLVDMLYGLIATEGLQVQSWVSPAFGHKLVGGKVEKLYSLAGRSTDLVAYDSGNGPTLTAGTMTFDGQRQVLRAIDQDAYNINLNSQFTYISHNPATTSSGVLYSKSIQQGEPLRWYMLYDNNNISSIYDGSGDVGTSTLGATGSGTWQVHSHRMDRITSDIIQYGNPAQSVPYTVEPILLENTTYPFLLGGYPNADGSNLLTEVSYRGSMQEFLILFSPPTPAQDTSLRAALANRVGLA